MSDKPNTQDPKPTGDKPSDTPPNPNPDPNAPPAKADETPPEQKPIREMTDDELNAQHDQFVASMFGRHRKPAKPKAAAAAPDDGKPADPPVKPDDGKPADPPAKPDDKPDDGKPADPPPPAKPKEPELEPPPTLEEFQAKLQRGDKPVEEPPTQDSDLDRLPPKHREHHRILQRMAKDDPDNYSGLDRQFIKALKTEAEYISGWLKSNPGKRFSAKDEEHQEFYAGNTIEYDDGDYRMAERAIIREEARKEARAEAKAESERALESRRLKDAEAESDQAGARSVIEFISKADPDALGKHLTAGPGGQLTLTPEGLTKMKEEDPIAYRVILEESGYLSAMMKELELFRAGDGKYQPKMDKTVSVNGYEFPAARNLVSFLARVEAAYLRAPAKDTMQDGKRLISNAQAEEFIQRVQADKQMNREQKNRALNQFVDQYYTLTPDHYRAALIEDFARRSKEKIKDFRAQYGKPAGSGKPAASGGGAVDKAKPASGKPTSISVSTASASDKLEDRLSRQDQPASEDKLVGSRAFNMRA